MTAAPEPTDRFDEVEVIAEFAESLEVTGLFVDVGAHAGRYAVRLAEIGWKVVAVEADAEIADLLADRLSGFKDAEAVCGLAWSESGADLPFHRNTSHWGTGSIRPFLETHEAGQPMTTTTVAAEVARQPAESQQPLIVKIDAEGADFEVLQGADIDGLRPRLVMVEFMDDRTRDAWGYEASDMVDYMERFGYRCLVSEWAAVIEHTKRSGAFKPFAHLGIARWPLGHPAAWGNLLFVQSDDLSQLEQARTSVLTRIGLEQARSLKALELLQTRAERLEQTVANRETKIAGLETTVSQLRERVETLAVVSADRKVERNAAVQGLERCEAELEQRAAELSTTAAELDDIRAELAARDNRLGSRLLRRLRIV